MGLEARISTLLGVQALRMCALGGGCVGEVYAVDLADGRRVVAKCDNNGAGKLDIEGWMLQFLAEHSTLPVPKVLHSSPELLLMEWVECGGSFCRKTQEDAADLLAALHSIKGRAFGLERDTLIGGLHQPNPWSNSWVDFFREHRLLEMAKQARDAGQLPAQLQQRLETFCGCLGEFIGEPPHPSLLHGDIWSGNVLAQGGRVAAFIDPAVYFGHPEVELAFITLFGTFGDFFFSRYNESRRIAEGFFEERRDVYNLYPLLVHVRLFGAGYLNGIDRCLSARGF